MSEEAPNIAERRFVIFLCREMRKHYEQQGNYKLMVYAEEQVRSARRHYREALSDRQH